jgi:hypothetical protein
MPQPGIILPIIVAGVTLGSLLVSGKHVLSNRKLLGACALSGTLNSGITYLTSQLSAPPTFTQGGPALGAATEGSDYVSYASSFLVGFLIVLLIVGIALIYAKLRASKSQEDEEPTSEET